MPNRVNMQKNMVMNRYNKEKSNHPLLITAEMNDYRIFSLGELTDAFEFYWITKAAYEHSKNHLKKEMNAIPDEPVIYKKPVIGETNPSLANSLKKNLFLPKDIKSLERYPTKLREVAFVNGYTIFEVFHSKMLGLIVRQYAKKKIDTKKAENPEIASKYTQIVSTTYNKYAKGSMKERLEKLNELLDTGVNNDQPDEKNFLDIAGLDKINAVRNLIVHNKSVITEKFMKRIEDSDLKIDTRFDLTEQYFGTSFNLLRNSILAIWGTVHENYGLNDFSFKISGAK